MDPNFLEFEQPIAELQAKISELRYVTDDSDINISQEIKTLERKAESLTTSIFSKLSAWQISQLSRHPNRPYSTDYIERIFTDFEYLHGDRAFADDHPVVREGLQGLLSIKPDFEVVGIAEDGEEAVLQAKLLQPDVIIMDADHLGDFDHIEQVIKDVQRFVPTAIIVCLAMPFGKVTVVRNC